MSSGTESATRQAVRAACRSPERSSGAAARPNRVVAEHREEIKVSARLPDI
jgi:hypothetical protein